MSKKKVYCPQCKVLFSPEAEKEGEGNVCPHCLKKVDDFLPKRGKKEEVPIEAEPVVPKDIQKKLMVMDLHKLPAVSSRTSEAKQYYQENSSANTKKREKKDFKEDFLDLSALKKRQLQVLQRQKEKKEEPESNSAPLPHPNHLKSEEIVFESLKKEPSPSPTMLEEEEDDFVATIEKIPENKQELLEKIDQLIHQTKEDKNSEPHSEKEKELRAAGKFQAVVSPPAKLKPQSSSPSPKIPNLTTSFFSQKFGVFLFLYCLVLQWQVFQFSSHSSQTTTLPPSSGNATGSENKQDTPVLPIVNFEEKIQKAIAQVAPAVVSIQKEYVVPGSRKRLLKNEVGSGFFFHKDGYILTNYHVIEQSENIWCVLSDGSRFRAEILGEDPLCDIAILRLDTSKPLNLNAVSFGKSASLNQGQFVLALGNPGGLKNSFSFGVISHTQRYLPPVSFELTGYSSGEMNTWLQIDTPINQGNSGGPLFNLEGEVIGINTRTMINLQNVSFALPIDVVKENIQSLMTQKSVERAFIGIIFREIPSRSNGVLVAHVLKGSPADRAGFQQEDVLLEAGPYKFSAKSLEDLPNVFFKMSQFPSNKVTKFLVERRQNRVTLEVTPRLRESYDNQLSYFSMWGFTGIPITEGFRNYLGDVTSEYGLYVTTTESEGILARHQITSGCIILSINQKPITFLRDFKDEYDYICQNKIDTVELSLLREDGISETRTLKINYY